MAEQTNPVFKNKDDAIMGLLGGITSVMEVVVMRELITDAQLRKLLSKQYDTFVKNKQDDSAAIIGLMMKTFGDQRESLRSLVTKPTEGTA